MSPELIGVICLCALLALMFLGLPIGICMAVVGFLGYMWIAGLQSALSVIGLVVSASLENYAIAVLPLFLLMGEFADYSGMMRESYNAANKLLGNLPGGLAMASVIGAGAFSAVSGSSLACAAIMTRVAFPQLIERKYAPSLAVGALCAGGTLGNLVPPGVLYILYAIMTQTSIGQLFVASLVPGAVLTIMYVGQIYIQCKIKPELGPGAGKTTWKEKLLGSLDGLPLVIVFSVIMGGIIFGMFTPYEAAATGTLIVLVYAVIRGKINRQNLAKALISASTTTGMALSIVIGAKIFTSFTAITNLTQGLTQLVIDMNISGVGFVIIIMLTFFILGTALDVLSMMLLTVPFLVGTLNALNVDLVWFGVLMIIQMELSNITPPTGMNIFVVSGMTRDMGITMGTIFIGVLPFCLTMVIFNGLCVAFPQITMTLVYMMRGG